MRNAIIASALIVLSSVAANAEPPLDMKAVGAGAGLSLPVFDMDAECGRPTGKQNVGRNVCLELEQRSYDDLKAIWEDLPIDVKDKCRSFDTYKSVRYRRIAVCVSAELDKMQLAKDQTEKRRFRY